MGHLYYIKRKCKPFHFGAGAFQCTCLGHPALIRVGLFDKALLLLLPPPAGMLVPLPAGLLVLPPAGLLVFKRGKPFLLGPRLELSRHFLNCEIPARLINSYLIVNKWS